MDIMEIELIEVEKVEKASDLNDLSEKKSLGQKFYDLGKEITYLIGYLGLGWLSYKYCNSLPLDTVVSILRNTHEDLCEDISRGFDDARSSIQKSQLYHHPLLRIPTDEEMKQGFLNDQNSTNEVILDDDTLIAIGHESSRLQDEYMAETLGMAARKTKTLQDATIIKAIMFGMYIAKAFPDAINKAGNIINISREIISDTCTKSPKIQETHNEQEVHNENDDNISVVGHSSFIEETVQAA